MQYHRRPKLLIADGHRLIAEGCKSFLEPEFDVVGITSDGRCLLGLVGELKPDAVILEIAMPGLNGLKVGEQIKRSMSSVKVIYLTMNPKPEMAAEAFQRGASGYASKYSTTDQLVTAVRKVLRGESYLDSVISKETVEYLLRGGRHCRIKNRATDRQGEVLRLLSEGKTMKEIADILNVRQATVAYHKYGMMHRLGLKTSAELLQYALKRDIA